MSETQSEKQFVTKRAFAEEIEVTERTLNTWMRDHGFPFSKVGQKNGSVRIHRPSAHQWLLARQQGQVVAQ